MIRLAVTVAALVVSAAASAHAAAPSETPAEPVPDDAHDKSAATATALSAAGTLVPLGMIALGADRNVDAMTTIGVLGLIAGPSIGHWYAGDYLTAGLGLRAAGSVLVIVGLGEGLLSCLGPDDDRCHGGGGALAVGAGLFVGGTIYDIATAGRATHRWNNAHHLSLAPTRVGTGPQSSTGLALGGTF